MAWRSYADPNTGDWWTTDDSGNWLPGNNADAWNTPAASTQPVPAVAASPTMAVAGGTNQLDPYNAALQQEYLRQRLAQLEIPMSEAERQQLYAQITGYYAWPGAGTMTNEQALDAIWKAKPDLANFYTSNGWSVDTPEQQRAAVQNWIQSADPANKGKTPQQVAAELGVGGGSGFQGTGAGASGATPTFTREQWNKANEQWGQQFGESQFMSRANLLASKSGPRDWAAYQAMQPSQAFGQMTPTRSWEQDLATFWNQGRAPSNVPAARQPTDIRLSEWNRMSPTQKEMERGKWSYWGIDPNDAEDMMRRAAPTGQAAPNTYWG